MMTAPAQITEAADAPSVAPDPVVETEDERELSASGLGHRLMIKIKTARRKLTLECRPNRKSVKRKRI